LVVPCWLPSVVASALWGGRGVSRGRLLSLVLVSGCVAGGFGGFGVSVAGAARARVFEEPSFGGEGAGAGSLSLVGISSAAKGSSPGSGLAVSRATGDVMVADTGNRRVDEFTSQGVFVRAWGWGVATGAAELQVCTTTCEAGLSSSAPGGFEAPSYIAVDNDPESPSYGDAYVADTGDSLVTKFTGTGALVSSWGNNGENASHEHTEPDGQLNGSPTEPFDHGAGDLVAGIAVDGSGHLWLLNVDSRLFEFGQDGVWIVTCTATTPASVGFGGIAVSDACKEHCTIYMHNGFERVQAVAPSCADAGIVTSGEPESQGLGVDGASGDVLVAREGVLVEDIPGSCVPSLDGCGASQVFGEEAGVVEPVAALGDASGLAVSSGSGVVFVGDAGSDRIDRFRVFLEATVGAASGETAHEALVHGFVNPKGPALESCRFEYGASKMVGEPELGGDYTASVPCGQSVGSGSSLVEVDALLMGLDGGTTYHYRVRAVDGEGGVSSEAGSFTTLVTTIVEEVSTSGLSASGATLEAVVNPDGPAALYHFEYGECAGACHGSAFPNRVPAGDVEVPAGTSPVTVAQPVTGLVAGRAYHFRIVISDVNGETIGAPEGTFVFEPIGVGCVTQRPGVDSFLGDCREYEMVTPPDKNGALIDNGTFLNPPVISSDGSRVLSQSIQCFDDPTSCTALRQTEGAPYAFDHTEAGWVTQPLAPPASRNAILAESAETEDVLYAQAAEPPALEELWARYPNGSVRAIGPLGEQPGDHLGSAAATLATTADLSRVVYQGTSFWPRLEGSSSAKEPLTFPGQVSGQPDLVAVTGGPGSTNLVSACGSDLGGNKNIHSAYGSLSADGSAAFFTAGPCKAGGTGTNAGVPVLADMLFERVFAGRTVLVSGSGPAGEGASECDEICQKAPVGDASFEGASSDGSTVFFTDTRRLTNDASEDNHNGDSAFQGCWLTAGVSSGCNLYEWVCPAHCAVESEKRLVDVSAGDRSGLGPRVQGVIAIPPSGKDVYFVARGVLTGANREGVEPVAGLDNLYVSRLSETGMDKTNFIGTLSSADEALWALQGGIGLANVTPDGNVLLFASHRALTGDVSRREGPAQVYRYDAETEELARVSIGQAGYNDNGNASVTDARIVNAYQGFVSGDGVGSANPSMSDSGNVVFFQSAAGLVPGALDDVPLTGETAESKEFAENVYEWEADGAKPAADAPACAIVVGCVSLISDGKDRTEGTDQHENLSAVELLGTDATGGNVFFWTADPILPVDKDSQIDLYDARIEGGVAEPVPVEPCSALGSCHEPVAVPPVLSPGEGEVFTGLGNAPVGSTEDPPAPPPPVVLSAAQKLKLELTGCRKKGGRARVVCERAANAKYRSAQLTAALKVCRREHGKNKTRCEREARARYAKASRAVGRSSKIGGRR
jgi:hypothetical protein